MTVKELKDKLSNYSDDAEIITYNRTSHRWFKTGSVENYPISTVGDTAKNCNDFSRRQLERFDPDDITFFF